MRSVLIPAAVMALGVLANQVASAASTGCAAPVCGHDASAGCDPCGAGHGCGWLRGRRGPAYEGLDPAFHCGCNGSYKYPVPPLYTYHWPGLYSAQLMTDYHSPWRFPPLKPYVDEVPPVEMGRSGEWVPASGSAEPAEPTVRSASARPAGEMEPLSSKLLR